MTLVLEAPRPGSFQALNGWTWPDCTGAMFGSSFLQTEESSLDLGLPRGLQTGGYKVWVWVWLEASILFSQPNKEHRLLVR